MGAGAGEPPGTLTPCPTTSHRRRAHRRRRPAITGYGIGSAALGVISVAAIALAALIWSHHRADADELRYRIEVLQAAADWTTVLINMNKDDVDASLQKLHDGTVGQLNADFDSAVEPYRKLVQTLQSRTAGQVDSVAVEFVHRPKTGPDGTRRPSRPRSRRSPFSRPAPTPCWWWRRRSARTPAASRRPCAGRFGLTSPTSTASC